VAAGTPTPGGGSVAGIVGALGAALGEMVVNLTMGRERFADADEALGPLQNHLASLREQQSNAALEDERAYAAYRSAAAMPRGSAEQKAARTAAMQEALAAATEAPLGIARAAAETAAILEHVAIVGNPHVRSDAALGALLAEAALRGALLNVRGNAATLRDAPLAARFREEADVLESRGREAAAAAFRAATAAGER
jgi:formiminotetrahydrofolate cyclodeaminase